MRINPRSLRDAQRAELKTHDKKSLAMAQDNKKQEPNKEDNKKGSNQGGGSERKSEGGQRGNGR
jgi:hypothetical protein